MKNDYSDIINLPHHVSYKHAHMSMTDRAGQFAPFAALTGFEDEVAETAAFAKEKNATDYIRESFEDSI